MIALAVSLGCGLAGCFESVPEDESAAAVEGGSATDPLDPEPENHPPEVSGVPQASVEAGQLYSFKPQASDADPNDFLEFQVTNKPDWAAFSVESGELKGTPGDSDVGQTADITIEVTDGREKRAIGPFRINVTPRSGTTPPAPANSAPQIHGNPGSVAKVGVQYDFQPSASDTDGDKLSFAISNRPQWASFSTSSGRLAGTPGTANITTYSNIVISVSDGKASVSLPAFAIQVQGPDNRAPTISGSPPTSVQATKSYSFQPSASDPDGDSLSFSISNKPAWASFSSASGRLNGTPTGDHAGTYSNIKITVSDGKATASLGTFSITVQQAPNSAPTISGTPPKTGKVGTAYSFQPTASDPDKDTLGFTVQNAPSWATFDTLTGKLSGTPDNEGTFGSIVITVSDGKQSASLPAFSIAVSANHAPTISGTPATSVNADNAYNFQPSANDADDDTLSWSIQNKPSWATFSTATGKLSGTPGTAQAGTYSNIVISVSDGKQSASLAAFAIAVKQATLGSAALSWQAPTQYTDGSSMSDLAGYRILYGTSASALTQTIDVSNASVTDYVVNDLSSGTWYFAVKAYTAGGAESANSNLASKTIP